MRKRKNQIFNRLVLPLTNSFSNCCWTCCMKSSFAGSTWIPFSEIRWPRTTLALHINPHFLSLKARWASSQWRWDFSIFLRASWNESPNTKKIIHVDFHTLQVSKNGQDFPLKGRRGITYPKGNHSVIKWNPWTCKSGFVLILGCNMYLVITAKAIWKRKVLLTSKGIEYLVDERKGEVIFDSGLIQFILSNKNSPSPIIFWD